MRGERDAGKNNMATSPIIIIFSHSKQMHSSIHSFQGWLSLKVFPKMLIHESKQQIEMWYGYIKGRHSVIICRSYG